LAEVWYHNPESKPKSPGGLVEGLGHSRMAELVEVGEPGKMAELVLVPVHNVAVGPGIAAGLHHPTRAECRLM